MESEKGFTLVEVMVALVVLSVGFLAAVSMQANSIGANDTSRRVTEAVLVAGDQLELFLNLPYNHPDLNDTNGDGLAGLRHPYPPLPAQERAMAANVALYPADYQRTSGRFTIYWNVATDVAPPNDTIKTINVIVATAEKGVQRSVRVEGVKVNAL